MQHQSVHFIVRMWKAFLSLAQEQLLHLHSRIVIFGRSFSERQLLLFLAFLAGLLSGLAAVLLKHTVHFVQQTWVAQLNLQTFSYLFYPAFGMLITVLFVRYVVRDNISHGVTRVLYAISRRNSKLKPHNNFTSIIASTFTIGFGGSVGAEAPIVLTGASIGSSVAQYMRLNYKNITLLLACGTAGAIAGIFKAPLTGIIFTLEVLMLDLTLSSIIPLMVSSVTATTVSYLMLGRDVVFTNEILPFQMANLPFYLLLGVLCGFVALYFTRATLRIEKIFDKIGNPYYKLLLGGSVLALLIFIFPPLYGEGYEVLTSLLNGDTSVAFLNPLFGFGSHSAAVVIVVLALVIFFKVIAMASTNGGGGVGGTFGPTLFVGGITGYFFSKIVNLLDFRTPSTNFTLVGMAGLMAAVMHAPLTAIFLIAEITGGYTLLFPLIITSTIAYITIQYFEKHSIYTKRLAQRGELLTHNKDQAVLTLLNTKKVVEKDFIIVRPTTTLRQLIELISISRRNVFPVLNSNNELQAIILVDDIRHIMFDISKYDQYKVEDFMVVPPAVIKIDENMKDILDKFEFTGAWYLPVIDTNNKYYGFLSKSKILATYREILIQVSK